MKQYKLSFEEYLKTNSLILGSKRWFFQILFSLAMIGLLALIFFLFSLIDRSFRINTVVQIVIFAGTVVFVAFAYSGWQKKGLKKIYDSQKGFQENIKVAFNNAYIEWSSDLGSYKINWQEIYRYQITDDLVVIYSGENFGIALPTRIFESDGEKSNFFELFKSNVLKKK